MDRKAELRKARPKLKQVSPLAHWIVYTLGVFNIFLGVTLFFAIDQNRLNTSLLIVNEVFTFRFWGVVFLSLGLIKLYSLYSNHWILSRKSLLVGVSIKAAWAVALTIRVFVAPGTLFIMSLWIALAAIQMACYIFFMPPSTDNYLQRRSDRNA